MTTKQSSVEAAPSGRQCQNGLVERNWRTIVRMARSWLTSSLLPSEYWWFAVKRAVEVTNYLPIKANNKLTTPYELVYGIKPDLRLLFPLFSLAYVHRLKDAQSKHQKFQTTAILCILVGKSSVSDGLEFYHPPSRQIITSSDFKLDTTKPSGPAFNLKYDGGLFFNLYDNDAETIRPPGIDINTTVFVKHYDPPKPATVLAVPFDESDVYTVQFQQDGSIHQFQSSSLLDHDPTINPQNIPPPLPTWTQHHAQVTVLLPAMDQPKKGRLVLNPDTTWSFQPGRLSDNETLNITDIQDSIFNKHIIPGHIPFTKFNFLRQNINLQHVVARHVSAANLHSLDTPTLVKHL